MSANDSYDHGQQQHAVEVLTAAQKQVNDVNNGITQILKAKTTNSANPSFFKGPTNPDDAQRLTDLQTSAGAVGELATSVQTIKQQATATVTDGLDQGQALAS
jgi:hypothetical protein